MEQLIGFAIFVGIAVIVGTWLAGLFLECIGFFPFCWGLAKENPKEENPETSKLTLSTGVVTKEIIPPGQGEIKYSGSFWQAVAVEPIPEETIVQIVERKGLIIHVRPFDADKEL
jgi:membrane protein implicated in regulation of membrane protease activity